MALWGRDGLGWAGFFLTEGGSVQGKTDGSSEVYGGRMVEGTGVLEDILRR